MIKKAPVVSPDHSARFAAFARELTQTRDAKQAGIYCRWLSERTRQGRWAEDDTDRALQYLRAFHDHRIKLTAVERDLFRYSNLLDLYRVLRPYLRPDEPPPRSTSGEMLWIYRDASGLKLGMPRTMAAAQRYGRGTKWCVAATKSHNWFWAYAMGGPLLYIFAGKRKYCWYLADDKLIRADDELVEDQEARRLIRAYPQLPELLFRWLDRNRDASIGTTTFPAPLKNAAFWQLAADCGSFELACMPDELKTPAVCRSAVQRFPWTIADVPERLRTADLCRLAASRQPDLLRHVPGTLRTQALYRHAVTRWAASLACVPEEFRTANLCARAVSRDGSDLNSVPLPLRTADLCRMAVTSSGLSIADVPRPMRTRELYELAVRQHGDALAFVPRAMRTPDLCAMAVAGCGMALAHVPRTLRTYALCLAAVRSTGGALRHVPRPLRSSAMCRAAVAQDGEALRYVPTVGRTPALCSLAVQTSAAAIRFAPMHCLTRRLCKEAVTRDGWVLAQVPINLRTNELCLIAVSSEFAAIAHVPAPLQGAVATAVLDRYARLRSHKKMLACFEVLRTEPEALDLDWVLTRYGYGLDENGRFGPLAKISKGADLRSSPSASMPRKSPTGGHSA